MLLWVSSGIEPCSVAVGEFIVWSSAEFEFSDPGVVGAVGVDADIGNRAADGVEPGPDGVLRAGRGAEAVFVPPEPASWTEYAPGRVAQCDLWFRAFDVPVGFGQVSRPPVMVMVFGFSRVINIRMLSWRQSPDVLAGRWELMARWGRLPRKLVWDNGASVGRCCPHRRRRAGRLGCGRFRPQPR